MICFLTGVQLMGNKALTHSAELSCHPNQTQHHRIYPSLSKVDFIYKNVTLKHLTKNSPQFVPFMAFYNLLTVEAMRIPVTFCASPQHPEQSCSLLPLIQVFFFLISALGTHASVFMSLHSWSLFSCTSEERFRSAVVLDSRLAAEPCRHHNKVTSNQPLLPVGLSK